MSGEDLHQRYVAAIALANEAASLASSYFQDRARMGTRMKGFQDFDPPRGRYRPVFSEVASASPARPLAFPFRGRAVLAAVAGQGGDPRPRVSLR